MHANFVSETLKKMVVDGRIFKIDVKGMEWSGVVWIYLAQDRHQGVADSETNLRVARKEGNFLTS
jgi:hypothetical protein